jgi:hypothetical protein
MRFSGIQKFRDKVMRFKGNKFSGFGHFKILGNQVFEILGFKKIKFSKFQDC